VWFNARSKRPQSLYAVWVFGSRPKNYG